MEKAIRYSVIIPIYNGAGTVSRCLDSLLHGIPEDAELLVINDGSTDDSGAICEEYAEKYQSIRYFSKENGGVSSARNLGLEEAGGEYILFADCDDYVSGDYWQTITALLEEHQPDMLQFGFQELGGVERIRGTGDYVAMGEVPAAEKAAEAMRAYLFSSLQVRAFRGALIRENHLRFAQGLSVGEDQSFIFSFAMHMKSLVSAAKPLYIVMVDNAQSLSRRRRENLTQQLMEVNRRMFHDLREAQLSPEARRLYEAAAAWVYYRSAYSACKELTKFDLAPAERRKKIGEICRLYAAGNVRPVGMKCRVIALPVQLRMSRVIDGMICRGGTMAAGK